MQVNPNAPVTPSFTEALAKADPSRERAVLAQVIATQPKISLQGLLAPAPADVAIPAAASSADQATRLDRRLGQVLRAFRREAASRSSPAALRVLGYDALR